MPEPLQDMPVNMVKEKNNLVTKSVSSSHGTGEPEPGILSVKVISGGSVVCTLGEKFPTSTPVTVPVELTLVPSAAKISASAPLGLTLPSGSESPGHDDSEVPDQECSELPVPEYPEVALQGESSEHFQESDEVSHKEDRQLLCQEYRGGTFKCSQCGGVFSSESDVTAHVCAPTKKNVHGQFRCKTCEKVYRWKKDLNIHTANACKDGPLECSVCTKAFCTKNDLDRHERKHAVKKAGHHQCPTCEKVYRWKKDLVIHMSNVRNQKPMRCLVCDKAFCTNRDLARHFRGHAIHPDEIPESETKHDIPSFEISSGASVPSALAKKIPITTSNPLEPTSAVFGSSDDVATTTSPLIVISAVKIEGAVPGDSKYLVPSSSGDGDMTSPVCAHDMKVKKVERHPCPTCGRIYKWKKDLQIHMANSDGPVECSVCEKTFCMNAHLARHLHIQHPEVTPFKCTSCDKAFSQKWALNNHLRSHCEEKKFRCDECEKKFITQRRLDAHLICHRGEKPFRCLYCEKVFRTKAHMTLHVRIHTGEKPFQCSYCGKCFISNGELTLHTRVHTGEKPFKCSFCDKAFSGSCRLVVHVRAMHTHEKPYLCPYCAKTFVSSAQMKKHMRVHTGEKPYKCSHCEKRFSQASARKTHEYVHTGERPFVCTCKKSFTQKGLLTTHKRNCPFENDHQIFSPLQTTQHITE
jgi:KRAB domain-containing zinc finger protein